MIFPCKVCGKEPRLYGGGGYQYQCGEYLSSGPPSADNYKLHFISHGENKYEAKVEWNKHNIPAQAVWLQMCGVLCE